MKKRQKNKMKKRKTENKGLTLYLSAHQTMSSSRHLQHCPHPSSPPFVPLHSLHLPTQNLAIDQSLHAI